MSSVSHPVAHADPPPWIATIHAKLDALIAVAEEHHKPLLTVDEVADLTGRSAYTVRRWVKQGLLRARRVDGAGPKGRLLTERGELERLLRRGLAEQVPAAALAPTREGGQ